MALGSGTNDPVNHWRAVHQRVREFRRLLSGSGREHIRSQPGPAFAVSEQRIRPTRRDRRNPLESTENANARPDACTGARVNRMVRGPSEIKNGSPKATLVGTFACSVPSVKRSVRALADHARRVVRPPLADRHRAEDHDPADAGPAGQIFFLTTAATSR